MAVAPAAADPAVDMDADGVAQEAAAGPAGISFDRFLGRLASNVINAVPQGAADLAFLITGNQNRVAGTLEDKLFFGEPYFTQVEPRRLQTWKARLRIAWNGWARKPRETFAETPELLQTMGGGFARSLDVLGAADEEEAADRLFNLTLFVVAVRNIANWEKVLDRATRTFAPGDVRVLVTPQGATVPVLVAAEGGGGVAGEARGLAGLLLSQRNVLGGETGRPEAASRVRGPTCQACGSYVAAGEDAALFDIFRKIAKGQLQEAEELFGRWLMQSAWPAPVRKHLGCSPSRAQYLPRYRVEDYRPQYAKALMRTQEAGRQEALAREADRLMQAFLRLCRERGIDVQNPGHSTELIRAYRDLLSRSVFN